MAVLTENNPTPQPGVENPDAGQGPVVLDIGGDIGALIVTMPASMVGLEVEIVPSGTWRHHHGDVEPPQHSAGHHHHHGGPHSHGPGQAPPHVAVVARPLADGSIVHSLVFSDLRTGRYDLYVRPSGPVRLAADIVGGEVTFADWPESV